MKNFLFKLNNNHITVESHFLKTVQETFEIHDIPFSTDFEKILSELQNLIRDLKISLEIEEFFPEKRIEDRITEIIKKFHCRFYLSEAERLINDEVIGIMKDYLRDPEVFGIMINLKYLGMGFLEENNLKKLADLFAENEKLLEICQDTNNIEVYKNYSIKVICCDDLGKLLLKKGLFDNAFEYFQKVDNDIYINEILALKSQLPSTNPDSYLENSQAIVQNYEQYVDFVESRGQINDALSRLHIVRTLTRCDVSNQSKVLKKIIELMKSINHPPKLWVDLLNHITSKGYIY